MKLSNLSILQKMAIVFALLAIVAGTSIWHSSVQLRRIDSLYSDLVEKTSRAALLTSRANGRLYNLGRQALALNTATSEEQIKAIGTVVRTDQKAFKDYMTAVKALAPNYANLSDDVMKKFAAAGQYFEAIETRMLAGKFAGAAGDIQSLNKKSDEIRKDLYSIISGVEAAVKTASGDATLAVNATVVWTTWGSGAAFTATFALAVTLILMNITTPLTKLAGAMRDLANGDLGAQVPGVGRRDEVGQMADALNVFKGNAQKAHALEEDARLNREAAECERARNEADREAASREQKFVVDHLAHGLSALAQRDLTLRLSGLPSAYRQLELDFNAAVQALRETMQAVADSGGNILTGSAEVSSAADDLARRTEQQAASLEQTAAALDQITATGKRAAEGAEHAREVVRTAQTDAHRTGEVVRRTVEAMGGIEQSSEQITRIIGVIDEIAFQTNLLALNAGVEAARAGEAGRGFAVVASEVRALAQRSAGAAKEIKGLISTSTAQVAQGASLVAETGQALERILSQVTDINKAMADIAAGAQEQATGLAQVNTAINQMDQATQQNAAMVEQSTAASHSLSAESRQLAALIDRFRIGVEDREVARKAA